MGRRRRKVPKQREIDMETAMKWFVRYQVKGESFAQIAVAVGESEEDVREICRQIANLLPLPLRPETT